VTTNERIIEALINDSEAYAFGALSVEWDEHDMPTLVVNEAAAKEYLYLRRQVRRSRKSNPVDPTFVRA